MYPVLFRIGHFSISTYGVVVALAFVLAGWVDRLPPTAAYPWVPRGSDPSAVVHENCVGSVDPDRSGNT